MRLLSAVVLSSLLAMSATAAATTKNDDACDIALLPAATLLLPYFEVDFNTSQQTARTTLFTVQNTTAMPQIARVTLWTDWSYPMLTFDLFLTGYDVQSINLYDVFRRGTIAPAPPKQQPGTSNKTPPGDLSLPNDQNPHFLPDAFMTCSNNPGVIGAALLSELQTAFTTGKIAAPGCTVVNPVGGIHSNAAGYATIDVVANCSATSPIAPGYFTHDILFDNVLTGDVQHINPNPATGNYAGGNPLVHIRAIPEGGAAGTFAPTPLPFTFYDLYTTGSPQRAQDRRQPLPTAFMPRFIEGGTGAFNTNLQLWHEAFAAPAACPLDYRQNSNRTLAEAIRFDEHENARYYEVSVCAGPPTCPTLPILPASTGSYSTTTSFLFPERSTSGDVGGWLYLNLNNGGAPAYSAARKQSQSWVVTSMFAEGRYAVEMDALPIGNGCSPAPALSKNAPIAPAEHNDDSCDIALLPAATLFLPYFEVDFQSPSTTARTTIFTIQNTTARPQIARVTLWTDWAYPMLTFNVFLTGYDVQGINLYDIFRRGSIAPPSGTSNKTPPGTLSLENDQNPHFLPDAIATCGSNPSTIAGDAVLDLQKAFTTGKVTVPGCGIENAVGGLHFSATGYATIDVVANCNPTSPRTPSYFTNEILFDNVLTGDYQHLNPNPATGNYAAGNPLVHIRAIPEGGAAGTSQPTPLPYTFYDLYTAGSMLRTQDRRQPLPSAFLPRFIAGGTGAFSTNLQIWREAIAAPTTCPLATSSNGNMRVAEIVRFDEHENPTFVGSFCGGIPECPPRPGIAAAVEVWVSSSYFPLPSTAGDVAGWLFLNLNNGGSPAYSSMRNDHGGTTTSGPRQSQAWVVTSMFAEGRYAVEMDGAAVGNGCSPAPDLSTRVPIGPAP